MKKKSCFINPLNIIDNGHLKDITEHVNYEVSNHWNN